MLFRLNSLFNANSRFHTEAEPESASRERNKTWTAGYAQQNDIRQAVRMAKNSSFRDQTDPACASPLRPPVTPDAFGLLKAGMKKLVLGKSSSKNYTSSKLNNSNKPNKYSKQNATQQLKIIRNNENNSSKNNKSPHTKTVPSKDKFQDRNDINFKPDQPDYTNFPRL